MPGSCQMSDVNNAVPTLQKTLGRKDREKQRGFKLLSSTKKFQKLLSAATRPDDRESIEEIPLFHQISDAGFNYNSESLAKYFVNDEGTEATARLEPRN